MKSFSTNIFSWVLPILLWTVLLPGAQAADQGHGKVTFTGAIIEAPCSIDPESTDQIVDLGQVSMVSIQPRPGKRGASSPVNFEIKLADCAMETMQTVSVTFSGAQGSHDMLGLTGTAKGMGIVLTDGAGTRIKLGSPSSSQIIQNGNNTLLFSTFLESNSILEPIVPGDFTAVADFTLEYS